LAVAKKTTSAGRKAAKGTTKQAQRKRKSKKDRVSVEHRTRKTVAREGPAKKGRVAKEYAKAEEAYRKYGNGILDKLGPHGVIGISFGHRFKDGKPVSEMAIRLHVETEEAKRRLKENAKEIGFTKTYGGVGTDIVVWDFEAGSTGGASTSIKLADGT
jgi:hypothetical protein